MFKLLYKPTSDIITIYNVKINKRGYTTFLVHLNNQWLYRSAKHFEPLEKDK